MTTLRVSKPATDQGWAWQPDIEWAYEHRSEIPAFLKANINDGGEVTLCEGFDCTDRAYIEFTNVTIARKEALSKKYNIDFYPKTACRR